MGAANYDHINPAEIQLSQLAVWATLTFEAHNSQARKKNKNAPFTSIIQQTHTREKKEVMGSFLRSASDARATNIAKIYFFFPAAEMVRKKGLRARDRDLVRMTEEGLAA